jgi:transposase
MKADYFEKWFVEHLLKAVPEGHTIIMDNASFHRKDALKTLAKQAGVKLLFLPPYAVLRFTLPARLFLASAPL